MKTLLIRLTPCALALTLLTSAPAIAQKSEVTGTGASFPAQVYVQWAADYTRQTGFALSYRPAGSSAGVKSVADRTADFGATDVPLPQKELDQKGLFQFPTLVGGIVPFVNLAGIGPGELKLDAPTLARIWSGDIARWNDPAIRALNPGPNLPNLPIQRVVRSDGTAANVIVISSRAATTAAERASR